MMKKLLVISNHPVEKWSDEQKEGWDVIEYIPFPNIPATMEKDSVLDKKISTFKFVRWR